MELARDQVLDFARVGGVDESEAVDGCICCASCLGAIRRLGLRLGLANDEGESEHKLIVVGQF